MYLFVFTPLYCLSPIRVTRLSRLPSSLVELSEPLEVVRYEHGGYSHAHYDSSSTHPDASCAHTHLSANTSTPHQIPCRCVRARVRAHVRARARVRACALVCEAVWREKILLLPLLFHSL